MENKTERERLKELIDQARQNFSASGFIADYLLDNGVVFEDNDVKMMQFIGETLVEKIKHKIEKIEYPVGKTIFAMVINGFIIPAIHEAIEEAEKALERSMG